MSYLFRRRLRFLPETAGSPPGEGRCAFGKFSLSNLEKKRLFR